MGGAAFLRDRVLGRRDGLGEARRLFRRSTSGTLCPRVRAVPAAKRSVLERYLDVVKPVETAMKTGNDRVEGAGLRVQGQGGAARARSSTRQRIEPVRSCSRPWLGNGRRSGVLDRSRWDAFVARMQKEGVLTKADFDYVQGVWNLFDELKPARRKRTTRCTATTSRRSRKAVRHSVRSL
jgi:hypothetical protein